MYTIFSITSDYDGIMSCLWDTSNKEFGDMNYYDRKNDIWYDKKLKENFVQISNILNQKNSISKHISKL